MKVGSWKLEVGSWKLEVGSWRLEVLPMLILQVSHKRQIIKQIKRQIKKIMKLKTILLSLVLILGVGVFAAPKENTKKTAVFYVSIHCQGCVDKIEKNIPFEAGVKDLVVDAKEQSVKIVYDSRKTDVEKLKNAFEKIGKPVSRVVEQSDNTDTSKHK